MIVFVTWWSIPFVFLVVLIFQARKKSETTRQRSAVYALGVYLLFTIIGTLHIFSMRSSTAGIGLLFLPLISLVPAGIAYIFGYFHGRHKVHKLLAAPTSQYSAGMAICALLLIGTFGWQFSEILETATKNMERDITQTRRNTDIKENSQRVRWILSRNKGKEAEKLIELADQTTDDTMLMAIAGSRYAPKDLLDNLSRLNNVGITLNVIRNDNTGPDTLNWIFYKGQNPTFYYSDLARNKNTPEPILRTLYEKRHVNGGIPWSLASNESTPIDLLKKLANEKNKNVHQHLEKNKAYTK